uniref:Uncharacterized protein n=1 Tax=viral metagenome TaxID=1070528 RepID=A0A6M3JF92_9ZZZZ
MGLDRLIYDAIRRGNISIAQFDDGIPEYFGSSKDVSLEWVGATDILQFLPLTDDTGSINIGNGTKDIDLKVFLGTSAKYVLFDVGNTLLQLEDVDLLLGDNDQLRFGDGTAGDVVVKWDAANLTIKPRAADTGAIIIGDGTTDMDLKIFLGSAAKWAKFDVGNSNFETSGLFLKIHNHATTAEIGGAEFKGELVNASGAVYGVYNTWNYSPTGLTGTSVNVSAAINVMAITTGHTVTAGNIYGMEAHVQLAGTLNGAAVNAIGVNGVLSGAGANTLVLHMAGVASSMSTGLVNPTTGTLSYYLANSLSTVVVDNLICSLQAQYVTNFVSFDAAATDKCVEESAATPAGDTTHAIRVLIGGVAGYIPVYAAKTF